MSNINPVTEASVEATPLPPQPAVTNPVGTAAPILTGFIQQSSRVELGRKFEEGFYAKQESPSPQAVPAAGEPTISMTALLELLKDADPEVKAQLRLALLT